MSFHRLVLGTLFLIAGGIQASAAIIRVPADYPTIQTAVNASFFSDTIIVSPGDYAGANLSFPRFPQIQGTNPADADVVEETVIDGLRFDGPFDASHIQRISGITLQGNGVDINGGSGNITFQIANCRFQYCDIGVDLSNSDFVRVDVIACSFFANAIGVHSDASQTGPIVNVRDSLLEFNLAGLDGRFREVRNCRFADNVDVGAGLVVRYGDPLGLVFTRNHVSGTSGTGVEIVTTGVVTSAVVRVHNNYVVRNAVGLDLPDESRVDSNTIALNDNVGLRCQNSAGTVPIRNTILYGNGMDLSAPIPEFDLSYCCLTQFQAGTGNIALDPQFADPAGLDFHLLSGSPCINRGSPVYDWSIATVDSDNDQRVRGNRIDIGADETAAIGPSLLGDLNGDGLVNGLDIQTIVDMLIDG